MRRVSFAIVRRFKRDYIISVKRLLLIIFLAFATPAAAQISTAEIDRRASLLMNQLEMTGLAVAIVENGQTTFAKGYGETLRDSGELVTADTVFRWASVSKGVAANTLLSLVEEGAFNLADSAESLAPSLDLPGPESANVNLVHLLSHQTGIVRNAYDNRIEGGRAAKPTRAALSNLKPICAPGTCHTYQNVAYDASSEIIEEKTNLAWTVRALPWKA